MKQTVAFVTSQFSGDRIITSAKEVAAATNSQLMVVGIMDNQYQTEPEAIDYLFKLAKENNGIMQLIFRPDSLEVMKEVIAQYNTKYIVSGMPSSNQSVLYDVWSLFPEKNFFTIDTDGETIEVANHKAKVGV